MVDAALQSAIQAALEAAERGALAEAWAPLLPLRHRLREAPELARLWLMLWRSDPDPPATAEVLGELAGAWPEDAGFVALYLRCMLKPIDGRPGEEPVAADDVAHQAVALGRRTLAAVGQGGDAEARARLWSVQASALRLAGPAHDQACLAALDQAEACTPDGAGSASFDRGLLYKNRGRWAEALDAFQRARAREEDEPTLWNIAICATALGDGARALEAWQALGFDLHLGPDGLPVMEGLGRCKVRLSNGGPGYAGPGPLEYEHVWARSISPCHGVVLNPTQGSLRADYADLVLWDGAPIGFVSEGEQKVPRFPLLAKLQSGGAKKLYFRARQPAAGTIEALSRLLPDALWLYVFDESVRLLCARCIQTGGPHEPSHERGALDAERGHAPPGPSQVVEGALIVEPESDLAEARRALEPLLAATPGLSFAIPSLYEALGDAAEQARHRALDLRLAAPAPDLC